MTPPFRVEQLDKHSRSGFSCGQADLDAYFERQVTQDVRRGVAKCFVAIDVVTGHVVGFYTLAAASIVLDELPDQVTKRLPRYPSVPAVRIGRMAVASSFQRRGLGDALLADAAQRTASGAVAAYAIVVDAKHDVITFYERFGFVRLKSQPSTLFMSIETIRKAQR